ncbi:MAG TPA: 50S ribosomal protein L24 [Acidobacteriota bacterium]|nr:50S ribosomal protein L24 [Acidobacteriota bacterium]
MRKSNVRKGDTVKVIAGKDSGKGGKVLRVLRNKGLAIVEHVNFIKKHVRPNPQRNIKGGIMEREAPMEISNLRVVCGECGAAKGFNINELENGRKVRICKACGGQVGKTA